jgi:hypothetical protein
VDIRMLVVVGLVGWCGTPMPRPPIPKDPIAGFIGGILGALLVHWAMGFEGALSSMDFVAVAIGALAGGRVLYEVVNWVFPTRPKV